MNFNSNGHEKNGFSILELILAVGISGVVVLGTSHQFADLATTEATQERNFWLVARRMEIQSFVRSSRGWNSILAENSGMACLTNGSSCLAASTPQPLRLPLDGAILNGAQTNIGMNNKGEFCSTFDGTAGNSSCPIGIHLSWIALCEDSNCLYSQPKVIVKFRLKETGKPTIALTSYDLFVFKDPKLESLNEMCTAMGGTLSGTSCAIASLATTCDPSNAWGSGPTYPLGFGANGEVKCGNPKPGACSSSDIVTGFNSDGAVVCTPACL